MWPEAEGVAPTVRRWIIVGWALIAMAFGGCGGGVPSQIQPPPPPLPDFALSLSASSLTIDQGTTSSGIQVAVQPINGFSGSVQVTLTGLSSGVAANPASPFDVASGSSVTLLLGASPTAATGNASVTAQGTSGNLAHSANLGLTVQSSVAPAISRTAYVRNDSIPSLDQPADEPHHRHLVYDAANHHLFVANNAANRVEVFSSQDASRVASVDVPGASSVELSPDGTTAYAGTVTQQIAAIDTTSLQRIRTWQVGGLVPLPNTVFDRPEEVTVLSSGQALVRLRQAGGAKSLLAVWDPSGNLLNDLTSSSPQLFQSGVGVIARSGDHSRLLVAANDASGLVAIYDGAGNIMTGARTIGSGAIVLTAANQDGSQFVAVLQSAGSETILLLDPSLNVLATRATSSVRGITFSRDGVELFVAEAASGNAVVTTLATTDLHSTSQILDLNIQDIATAIEDADESGFVFGLSNRGVAFLDTAKATTIPVQSARLADAPAATPGSGPNIGGTSVTLGGQDFGPSPTVRFGAQAAPQVTSSTVTQIQATSPASVFTGVVNVAAYFANGTLVLAPDAFSYGPQVLEVLPNAGNNTGGDIVSLYGYGFGEDASKVQVKFGQSSASVQKVEDATAFAASIGLDPTNPFPLQRITVVSPAGAAGVTDVAVSTPDGAVNSARAFQYLKTVQVYPRPNFYKFLSYDQKRDRVYASDIDHVDVFDSKARLFSTVIFPPGGPPPNSLIRQATLTPDSSQLAIADFGAQSIYLINPDTATGNKVFVGGVPGDSNSGPVRIAATSEQTLFIGLVSFTGGSSSCGTCLQQMNLASSPATVEPAPQPDVSLLTSAPLLDASDDGGAAFFAYPVAPGQPMAAWNSATPQQFAVAQTSQAASDLAVASDGVALASRVGSAVEIRNQSLSLRSVTRNSELEGIPSRTEVPGIALHPSGALVYVPFLTGPAPVSAPFTGLQGGVDILDANTGRLRMRVMLPEPPAMLAADSDGLHAKFLTIDENGQRLFALTASGLTVVELAHVPLGFGTISPSNATASSGALTMRGSGFASGTTVKVGTKSAAASFVDMNTLRITLPAGITSGPQRLTIANPDGETIAVDAAVNVN